MFASLSRSAAESHRLKLSDLLVACLVCVGVAQTLFGQVFRLLLVDLQSSKPET